MILGNAYTLVDVAGCVGETMCKFVMHHPVVAVDQCDSRALEGAG